MANPLDCFEDPLTPALSRPHLRLAGGHAGVSACLGKLNGGERKSAAAVEKPSLLPLERKMRGASKQSSGSNISPIARGASGRDPRARAPPWPLQLAPRGCLRKDRAGLWFEYRSHGLGCRWCGGGSGSKRLVLQRNAQRSAGRSRCRPKSRPRDWRGRTAGRQPQCAFRRHYPRPKKRRRRKPAPISTPFTAFMLINAAAMSWSSLP